MKENKNIFAMSTQIILKQHLKHFSKLMVYKSKKNERYVKLEKCTLVKINKYIISSKYVPLCLLLLCIGTVRYLLKNLATSFYFFQSTFSRLINF